MIEKYRFIPYVKGGRTIEDGLDCWGLVRLLYNDLYSIELPLFSNVDPLDKRSLTKSSMSCISSMSLVECDIKEGAITTGIKGKLCYHIGIVMSINNRLMVVETDENTGFCITPVDRFKSRYTDTKFYDRS